MSSWSNALILWLADYHLLAAALVGGLLAVMTTVRQPARRMAAARAGLIALTTLALLCALPGWSVFHLITAEGATAPTSMAIAQPATHIDEPVAPSPADSRNFLAEPPAPSPVIAAVERPAEKPHVELTWIQTLALAYLAGCALILAWIASGAILAGRLLREAVPAPEKFKSLLAAIVGRGPLPRLLLSSRIATPVAIGIRRPTIVLPAVIATTPQIASGGPRPPGTATCGAQAMDSTEHERLIAILAHEWAHLRHGDLWTLAISRTLLVLLWPQPFFWLLRRTIRLDQETLADAAAAEHAGRVPYAEQLLTWARSAAAAGRPPRIAAAVGLWESPSQLKRRLAILLDQQLNILRECSRRWKLATGLLCVASAVLLSLVTVEAQQSLSSPPAATVDASDGETAEEVADPPPQEGAAETAAATPAETVSDEQPLKVPREFGEQAPNNAATDSGGAVTQHRVLARAGVFATVPLKQAVYRENYFAARAIDEQGQPLSRVEAGLYRASQRDGRARMLKKTLTNDNGEVAFRDVVPADEVDVYRRLAEAGRFPSGDHQYLIVLQQPGKSTVIAGAMASDVALYGRRREAILRPAAELSGRVTDAGGRPVPGALVAVGERAGMFAIKEVNAVETDADGRYRFVDRAPINAEKVRAAINQATSAATRANRDAGDLAKREAKPIDPREAMSLDLVVKHPDFAVTRVECGDVPGTTDVQLAAPAAIAGRVKQFDGGKPAVGVQVMAVGRLDESIISLVEESIAMPDMHSASTTTDERGDYRLTNLPAGKYDVWAQPPTQDFADAEWISRGVGGVDAKAGDAATAPELVIGPGGTVRGRLVDFETRQPVRFEGDGAIAKVFFQWADEPGSQYTLMQTVAVRRDGTFDMRAFPGKTRPGVFVYRQKSPENVSPEFQSDDELRISGGTLEIGHGETRDFEFRVRPIAQLTEQRALSSNAYGLANDKKWAEAAAAFSDVIAKFPSSTSALRGRAQAYENLGRWSDAISDYQATLKQAPADIHARVLLADLLATAPEASVRDGRQTVELATHAVAVLRKEPNSTGAVAWALAALAAAHAELGEFDQAIAVQRESISLSDESQKQDRQSRLELYERRQPFRRESE